MGAAQTQLDQVMVSVLYQHDHVAVYTLEFITEGDHSEDVPGSSDNGSSAAVSEQPRTSLSHQV